MGDTGLFPDMQFIAEHYKPDLVLMPIGGNFTMDPLDAAYAARTWVKARNVIPMHYGANPLTAGKPEDFVNAMKGSSSKVTVMTEGQTVEF
jgi:L-ascorbate metabolism protein UlaG (beta-lactamase superfamily)